MELAAASCYHFAAWSKWIVNNSSIGVARNLSLWSATPGAANEAVWAAKNKLDDVLDEFETLEDFLGSDAENSQRIRAIFEFSDNKTFSRVKGEGVGVRTLQRFLGKKWENTINGALSALSEDAARAHTARLKAREARARAGGIPAVLRKILRSTNDPHTLVVGACYRFAAWSKWIVNNSSVGVARSWRPACSCPR